MRKHRQQMSKSEVAYVEKVLKSLRRKEVLPKIRVLPHCIRAMNDHREPISYEEIVECLLQGSFFEVNNHGNSLRIVLRYTTSLQYDTIIVVDVREKAIVTTYKNDIGDSHDTLDWSEYCWYDDIRKAI